FGDFRRIMNRDDHRHGGGGFQFFRREVEIRSGTQRAAQRPYPEGAIARFCPFGNNASNACGFSVGHMMENQVEAWAREPSTSERSCSNVPWPRPQQAKAQRAATRGDGARRIV